MEYRKLGRFHIQRSVAKGGMGEIVRSVDDAGRPIALKTILDTYQADKKFRELFIREAEITFQLDHPNIVRAYRFDEVGRRLILALEYLEGVNLKEVLRAVYERQLRIPLSVATQILRFTLRGLHYAHQKKDRFGRSLGIVHRDLNPSNIFITYSGEVKILDFGISKATQVEVHQLTPKNELRGKVCYLSPEQINSKPVDRRTDIFSLGIVLWEVLAGKPLFLRDTDAEVMEAILHGEYEPLSRYRDDLPAEIEVIIKKALHPDPKKRFQDCKEFEEALVAATYRACMAAAGEEEISVFIRSLFNRVENREDPHFLSGYAWLMVQMPGQEKKGLELAERMAKAHPSRPFIQLNYARAMLLVGNKSEGLRLLRKLARVDSLEEQIQEMLVWLGVRRKPVIPVLSRSNPINYGLGWIRHRILGPTPYQEQFLAA